MVGFNQSEVEDKLTRLERARRIDVQLSGKGHLPVALLVPPAEVAEAARKRQRNDSIEDSRAAKLARRSAAISIDLRTCKVYLDVGASDAIKAAAQAKCQSVVQDRMAANCWVVSDPTNPGQRVEWCVTLGGGVICCPPMLLTGTGPFVRYRAGTLVRRFLWVSDAFKAHHRGLHDIIQYFARRRGSRLSLLARKDEFLQKATRAAIHSKYVVALVTAAEVSSQGLRGKQNVATVLTFCNCLQRREDLALGYCGS